MVSLLLLLYLVITVTIGYCIFTAPEESSFEDDEDEIKEKDW
jgi:hypothetical protein